MLIVDMSLVGARLVSERQLSQQSGVGRLALVGWIDRLDAC